MKTTLKQLIQLKSEGRLKGAFCVEMNDYHAGPGLSMSQLRNLKKSAKVFKHYADQKMVQSSKMAEGAAFDAYLFDTSPNKEAFHKEIAVIETSSRATKVWKELAAKAYKEGRTPIPHTVMPSMIEMEKAIKSHPIAKDLIVGASQISFYWIDEETGILCKCRPDTLPGNGKIVDLKVTDYVDKYNLSSIGTGLSYYMQAAFYTWGTFQAVKQQQEMLGGGISVPPFDTFQFLTVERNAPYDVAVTQYDDSAMEYGLREARKLLNLYKRCCETDRWPGRFEDKVVTLSLPDWVYKKESE